MALLVAGGPRRHHYWVPALSPVPEDEVVWVFQDPLLHLCTISLLQQCGTHHAIAADVEKFPFQHLCIKQILVALRSVPQAMTMRPTPPITPIPLNTTASNSLPMTINANPTTMHPKVDLDEINHQLICSIQSLWQMNEQLTAPPSTMTTMPMLLTATMTLPNLTTPECSNPSTITATTMTTSISDWLMPIPMMATMTAPYQPPLQHDLPLPSSSSALMEVTKPVTIDIDTPILQSCTNLKLG